MKCRLMYFHYLTIWFMFHIQYEVMLIRKRSHLNIHFSYFYLFYSFIMWYTHTLSGCHFKAKYNKPQFIFFFFHRLTDSPYQQVNLHHRHLLSSSSFSLQTSGEKFRLPEFLQLTEGCHRVSAVCFLTSLTVCKPRQELTNHKWWWWWWWWNWGWLSRLAVSGDII